MSETANNNDYQAWFECDEDCGRTYPLNEVRYHCSHCHTHGQKRTGLLRVAHDIKRLKQVPAYMWKTIFNERYLKNEWPYGSGVWGKKELVCPNVHNDNVVSLFEGGTNCFWAERFGKSIGLEDLWVKLCGNTHSGSFKDFGMTVLVSMVNQMIREGKPIRAVACASTGDTSASLAAYCATAGIPCVVILPKDKVSLPQLIQPVCNSAITLSLETDFDGCMTLVQRLAEDGSVYLANSMNSLRLEGQKTISIELLQQFDWQPIDWVIVPGGNLGNITALGNGFLMAKELGLVSRLPRLVCAQTQRANPLVEWFRRGFPDELFEPKRALPTAATAIQIGDPVNFYKAVKTLKKSAGSIVEEATEDELANAAAQADRYGLFNCPHTGVALAVLLKLVEQGIIKGQDRVVVISTANGLKFPQFKIDYHLGKLDSVESRFVNQPIVLPADLTAVRDAVERSIET